MDRLERDLYAIEPDGNGGKRIHVYGYAYDAEDKTPTHYRMVEFAFMYLPVHLDKPFDKAYDAAYDSCKQYVGDYSGDAIIKLLDNYFDTPPTALAYEDITDDTPCGYYICP